MVTSGEQGYGWWENGERLTIYFVPSILLSYFYNLFNKNLIDKENVIEK